MIDLANPNTDVIKLYKNFFRWSKLHGKYPNQGHTFESHQLISWLSDELNYSLILEEFDEHKKSVEFIKQILQIWSNIGLIEGYSSGTYKFKVINKKQHNKW